MQSLLNSNTRNTSNVIHLFYCHLNYEPYYGKIGCIKNKNTISKLKKLNKNQQIKISELSEAKCVQNNE